MASLTRVLVLAGVVTIASPALADDRDSLWEKAYPAATVGMVRHVLHLPDQNNENALQVELIVGKTVETDGINSYAIQGKISEEVIQGWGYPRYNVTTGGLVSTLIGVPPNQPPVKKFVTLGSGPYLIGYNSRRPVVVYAPKDVEVRYRLWKADSETKPMD